MTTPSGASSWEAGLAAALTALAVQAAILAYLIDAELELEADRKRLPPERDGRGAVRFALAA